MRGNYNSKEYYENNASIKRVVDSLIDGTFDDGNTGLFEDLYNSLIEEGDGYLLLADFESFKKAEDRVFEAYKDEKRWAKMAFKNMCNAGMFSSDRTILEYSKEIWNIKQTKNTL